MEFVEVCVHSLGRYITAENMGNGETIEIWILCVMFTRHVTGFPKKVGFHAVTAYGVFMGMKAAASNNLVSDSSGKKVLVQGIGHVGETLIGLVKEGAIATIADINEQKAK
jgi:leucine dehydrogenase